MAIVRGQGEPIKSLVKALGLDPKKTKRVEIIIEPDEAVIAIVDSYVYDSELQEMKVVIDRYKLKFEEDE